MKKSDIEKRIRHLETANDYTVPGIPMVARIDGRNFSRLTKELHDFERPFDAHRNALNAHAYWKLRGEGATERDATETLKGATVAQKNELLFQRGLNFNDLPSWQKRGVGLYWEDFEKASIDPRNQKEVVAIRRRIQIWNSHWEPTTENWCKPFGTSRTFDPTIRNFRIVLSNLNR